MMRVFINEREIAPLEPGEASVGEILEALRVHVDPRDIVTGVVLDGGAHSSGDAERWGRRRAAGVGRFEVRTETPQDFARGRRAALASDLGVVAAKVRQVVAFFAQGAEQDAYALLAVLMEELRLIVLLDGQLALLIDERPTTPREALETLGSRLVAAQERRSWQELAELLEAHLVPLLEDWSRTIDPADAVVATEAAG